MTAVTVNVWVPKTQMQRIIGLIGITKLPYNSGVLLPKCRWIHTYFMKLSIDCVGLCCDGNVISIKRNVTSMKIVRFSSNVDSILELRAGSLDLLGVGIGSAMHFNKAITRNSLLRSANLMDKFPGKSENRPNN